MGPDEPIRGHQGHQRDVEGTPQGVFQGEGLYHGDGKHRSAQKRQHQEHANGELLPLPRRISSWIQREDRQSGVVVRPTRQHCRILPRRARVPLRTLYHFGMGKLSGRRKSVARSSHKDISRKPHVGPRNTQGRFVLPRRQAQCVSKPTSRFQRHAIILAQPQRRVETSSVLLRTFSDRIRSKNIRGQACRAERPITTVIMVNFYFLQQSIGSTSTKLRANKARLGGL